MPFFKTLDKVLAAIDYNKTAEGCWRAAFHGFADVGVEARTLEECRREILDEIDLRLVDLVVPKGAGSYLERS